MSSSQAVSWGELSLVCLQCFAQSYEWMFTEYSELSQESLYSVCEQCLVFNITTPAHTFSNYVFTLLAGWQTRSSPQYTLVWTGTRTSLKLTGLNVVECGSDTSHFHTFDDLCLAAGDKNFYIVEAHITCISSTTIHRIITIRPQTANTLLSAPWTPPVCLTVTSLLLCCIKTVISFCIFLYTDYFCTLFIGLHFVMPLINKIKWMKNAMLKAVHHLYMCL